MKQKNKNEEFYDWLRDQFTDLPSAINWYNDWSDEQESPFGLYSMRAMSYHISRVLEGYKECPDVSISYLETQHGASIYMNEKFFDKRKAKVKYSN